MRVLLHSGRPLGPDGRAGLSAFLGERRRVAFVTAASLHDEAAYFARVSAMLRPPPPDVAGPTILTTNDWNVVALERFDALSLVAFNINPHYKETDPAMAPYSETRDDRIREYHVVNGNPVAGLEEGAWLTVEDGVVMAHGTARIKIFQPGQEP